MNRYFKFLGERLVFLVEISQFGCLGLQLALLNCRCVIYKLLLICINLKGVGLFTFFGLFNFFFFVLFYYFFNFFLF